MDSTVYDMTMQSEGNPAVFVRKDWLSILDNQSQNYQGNQSIIDTSQLSNSDKYMSYYEGILLIPLLITVTGGTPLAAGEQEPPHQRSATQC